MHAQYNAILTFYEQLLAQIEHTAGAMISFENYTARCRLLEAAKNLRLSYATDPTQLYAHLLNCMEYERKLLADPTQQLNTSLGAARNNSEMEISHTILNLQDLVRDCENKNRNLKRNSEDFNSLYEQFKKISAVYLQQEIQKPELRDQIAMAKSQQNHKIMAKNNEISTLKVNLIENLKRIVEEAEKVLCLIKTNYLFEWMKQQKLATLKHLSAQADSQLLDVIQSWYENLADILWKTYDTIKPISSYRTEIDNANEGSLSDNLLHLEQRTLKLLENLIVTSFIVEKQPTQIIVQEKNGGKK